MPPSTGLGSFAQNAYGIGSLLGGIGSIYGGYRQANMANKQFDLQKNDYWYNRKREEDRLSKLGTIGMGSYGYGA